MAVYIPVSISLTEKETIFHNLDSAEVKLDQERRRQAARLEELKERKRQKQTDNASKARELLEEADNLTKMLDKCKVQQQEKVKEIVQERKKKREESVPEVQTIHVKPAYDSSGSSNGGAGAGAGAAASPDEPSTDNWNTEMHI